MNEDDDVMKFITITIIAIIKMMMIVIPLC